MKSEEQLVLGRKRKRAIFEEIPEQLPEEEGDPYSCCDSDSEDGDSTSSGGDHFDESESESDWEQYDWDKNDRKIDWRDPDDAEQQAKKERKLILMAKQQLLRYTEEIPVICITELLETESGREALRALDIFGINYKTALLYLKPPHGRYMGRGGYQGGPSDWESGRGGFADSFNAGGNQREGMMSYKQFIQELEDDILPAEAERRYQEYRTEYISTQKKTYFNAHKDEEWLKDKYHPANLLSVIERRNELARKLAKDFQLDLQSGTLDLGPNFSPSSSNKAEQPTEPNSGEEADVVGKRRRPGRGGPKDDVLSAPKAHPLCSEPRRVLVDIEQAQSLARKLDTEKGIEDNVLSKAKSDSLSRDKSLGSSSGPVIIIRGLNTIKGLEGVELLDTLLTYLWRIHGVDYYGLVESNEAKGFRHVRVDGKSSDNIGNGNEWENKLDTRWKDRLKGSDPLENMTGKEKVDAAAAEALEPFVRKIRDEKYGWKYGCGAKGCTKLFHASEFVHKHLKLKHPELVTDVTTKVREELYIQNYMNDENAPGATPVMQTSLKDRTQRRRPGMDNRIKDDRGNRRDRDNRVNGNERFDRSDNPQPGDFANNDGNNPDEAMFDSFGGQGIPVAAFASDIPPPVLMPVPGAGPLGPFVPAPPEVAMQMLRDQGGPSPFDGGRNGRSGPQLGGPSPIIAMPPAMRQDPRRLRSYNDLDAPDDEVTVIDYRSL